MYCIRASEIRACRFKYHSYCCYMSYYSVSLLINHTKVIFTMNLLFCIFFKFTHNKLYILFKDLSSYSISRPCIDWHYYSFHLRLSWTYVFDVGKRVSWNMKMWSVQRHYGCSKCHENWSVILIWDCSLLGCGAV